MNMIILQLASKYVKPILLLFSIFVLLRGHNEPGGGFIAGLLAGSAYIFDAMARGIKGIQHLPVTPNVCMGIGLLLVLVSGLVGLITRKAVLKGSWIEIDVIITQIKLGTPLLFDTGIYFIVTGSLLMITFTILEEIQWK